MQFEQKSARALQRSMMQRIQHLAKKTRKSNGRITNILIMERFIHRINQIFPETTFLKGGLALEFRIDMPRTTKDIDIRTKGSMKELMENLRRVEAFRPLPEDHIHFEITFDNKHPTITGLGMKYDGYRFQVVAKMAGKVYTRFGLDVGFNDPIYGEPSLLKGDNFFEKYGIPPVEALVYPPTTHLAEKLHACTCPQPGGRVNGRYKDIVDMVVLAEVLDGYSSEVLYEAFEQHILFP